MDGHALFYMQGLQRTKLLQRAGMHAHQHVKNNMAGMTAATANRMER
jgi:hypothetical protein